ncbi:MAG: glycoside hydrolase family 127 protein [Kiritimatiellae bacterium]|nr:glycoside hydrolase family 127 protein [Kiritimatiellia bacterium]
MILASTMLASALAGFADISGIRLQGYVADRMADCIENHVIATDPLYFTSIFHSRGESNWWQSEFWGKYMHSAVPFWAYTGDARLKAKIDASVADIISTQDEEGYIGNYLPERRYGSNCWDVWGTKYTLLGLIHYYDETGDGKALEAAKRLADYLAGTFGPGRRELRKSGAFLGMPSCSVLEPVVWLYRRTGEDRYLDFAKYIRDELDAEDGARLVRDADVPVFGRVTDGGGWMGSSLKAYEMMSCYQGLLELYDETGESALFEAALKTARSIAETEINIVGGATSGEHWYDGANRQTDVYNRQNETCVITTWMRLCAKLLQETKDPYWADQIEKSFYNIYLATMNRDGSEFSQYCPLAGTRARGEDHCRMHTNCCNANGPRGFLTFLRTYLAEDGDTLRLNHYTSALVEGKIASTGKKAAFRIYTLYPQDGWLEARYMGDEPMELALELRHPGWCPQMDIHVSGEEVQSFPNPDGKASYHRIARVWKPGDILDFTMQMPAVAHFRNDSVAFTRGPVALARDLRFGDGDIGEIVRPEFARAGSLSAAEGTGAFSVDFDRVRAKDGFWMNFTATLPTGSHSESTRDWLPETVRFCDFASAGNTWSGDSAYRVWLPVLRFERHR